ncbi:MAG: nitroreductase family protein [Mycobacteriaceae bacterium]
MNELQFGPSSDLFHVMSTMRAMRRLKPDPVPEELLTKLVEAATWGPSGSNAQAYHYLVVTDKAQIAAISELWKVVSSYYLDAIAPVVPPGSTEDKHEKLRSALRYQRDHFHETPALIVACYDVGPYLKGFKWQIKKTIAATVKLGPRRGLALSRNIPKFVRLGSAASIYPGVQNLLLAARALGLGATLTTWHHFLESEFKAVLGIPARVETFAIIPVGWPKGKFGPITRRPTEKAIRRDRW